MAPSLRIPFEIAIAEPRLLKGIFEEELSKPQQVALKTLYGVQLDDVHPDMAGFTEQDYWRAFQGFGEYDKLGHLIRVRRGGLTPLYSPHPWREAWMISGVRSGKTQSFAAPIVAYEATCGGHEQWLRAGTRAVCFLIAQDLRFARWALPNIRAVLDKMPFMRSRISNETADRIDLWNGISIGVAPPSVKAVRGYDSPVAVFDEVGVWPQEENAANQDVEVYRQVQSRQAQFSDPLTVGVSSPWCKSGLLYDRGEAGTDGRRLACANHHDAPQPDACDECARIQRPLRGILVLHATTASMQNPVVKEEWLETQERQDPKAFERECLAQFVDVISGFLDPALLDVATDHGVRVREVNPQGWYLAAIDPAFRHDAFGLCIVHHEAERGIVVDVIKRWPEVNDRSRDALNPSLILDEIAEILRTYNIKEVVSDQFHIDTLQQLALNRGFSIRQMTFTGASKSEMYANLQSLLRQKRLHLLDHPEALRELRMIEKRNMPGGTIKIGGARGEHDDLATVVTLAAHQAVWMLPYSPSPAPSLTPDELRAKQIHERINKKLALDNGGRNQQELMAMAEAQIWE